MKLAMSAASLDSGKAGVRGASGGPEPAVFTLESPAPDSGLGSLPATSRGQGEVVGDTWKRRPSGSQRSQGFPVGKRREWRKHPAGTIRY